MTLYFDDLRLPAMPSLQFERVNAFNHALLDEAAVVYATHTTSPHADFDRVIDLIAHDDLRLVWFSSVTTEVRRGTDLILQSRARSEAACSLSYAKEPARCSTS